jgi:hypothetical protein
VPVRGGGGNSNIIIQQDGDVNTKDVIHGNGNGKGVASSSHQDIIHGNGSASGKYPKRS